MASRASQHEDLAKPSDDSHLSPYTPLTRAVQLHEERGSVRYIGYAKGLRAAKRPDPMAVYWSNGQPVYSPSVSGVDRVAELVDGVDTIRPSVVKNARSISRHAGLDFELIVVSCEADHAKPSKLRTFALPLKPHSAKLAQLKDLTDTTCNELSFHLRGRLNAKSIKQRKRTFREQLEPLAQAFLSGQQSAGVLEAYADKIALSLISLPTTKGEYNPTLRPATRLEDSFITYLSNLDGQTLSRLDRPPNHSLFPRQVFAPFTFNAASDKEAYCILLVAYAFAQNPITGEESRTLAEACGTTSGGLNLLETLLAAEDLSDLTQVLPNAIQHVRGVSLDWAALLRDLCEWGSPEVPNEWRKQLKASREESKKDENTQRVS